MTHHVRVLAGRVDRGAGSHVYHLELARRLAVRGHRVSLVCFSAQPDVGPNVEVHRLSLPPEPAGPFVWRFAAVRNYWHQSRALARLRLPPADVVIGGEHLFLKAHARKFPATPWLYLAHSLLVDQEIRSYNLPPLMGWVTTALYVHLQKWALKRATRTMRYTGLACEAFRKRYPGLRPRFIINPMPTDLPAGEPRPPARGPVRLLWVGQLIPRKRIDLALTALSQCASKDWVFDVVGDGDSRGGLEEQARRLGLSERVAFHGFQSDPGRWYRQADLLVFPSWLENFPVTMVEAMSHRVACLSMRGDGVRYHTANAEIVEHGWDGFLADSDEDFCRQLADLLREPERLRLAGEEARETVARRFTWDRHLDRLEELFDELTGARARQPRVAGQVPSLPDGRGRLPGGIPAAPVP